MKKQSYIIKSFDINYIMSIRREETENIFSGNFYENIEVNVNVKGDAFLLELYLLKGGKRVYEIITTVTKKTSIVQMVPSNDVLSEIKKNWGEKSASEVVEVLDFFDRSFKDYFKSYAPKRVYEKNRKKKVSS